MAASGEHCTQELHTDSSSPFSVSYFTLYLTRGIEVLEYYTKVRYSLFFLQILMCHGWFVELYLRKMDFIFEH